MAPPPRSTLSPVSRPLSPYLSRFFFSPLSSLSFSLSGCIPEAAAGSCRARFTMRYVAFPLSFSFLFFLLLSLSLSLRCSLRPHCSSPPPPLSLAQRRARRAQEQGARLPD